MPAMLLLLALAPAFAQLTSVSPSSANIGIVKTGSIVGPSTGGVTITLGGTGTVTWTNTCFGGIKTSVPGASATLPTTIRAIYQNSVIGATCTLNFTGGSGGTGSTTLTIAAVNGARAYVHTDTLGNRLTDLAYCAATNASYRSPDKCILQESAIRPGGARTAPAQGASYIDATYGAMVYNQGEYTRSYVAGHHISYNRDYVLVFDSANNRAVLHPINAANGSGDLNISGTGGICAPGSTSNIGLGTTAATATLGFCMTNGTTTNSKIKKFSFTGGVLTDLGDMHEHGAAMTGGLWGTGQAAADGWLSHFSGTNNLCVLNWFDASPTDTCITATYDIRNATLAMYPSRSTGLHYIFVGSDSPNKTTVYSFNPVTKALAVSGIDATVIDNPTDSTTNAYWGNRTCVVGVDCIVGGHHNTGNWGGEPYDCGTGRGRIQLPNYVAGGSCIRGYGWNTTTGNDIDSIGGPVIPSMSPAENYYVGARAPVAATTAGYAGQGLIPAWRISSCTASAGNATCTLAGSGDLDPSGWTGGSTPIYVDGFTGGDAEYNGRFTLASKTSTTFTYACAACSGATASNVASVTKDVAVATQLSFAGGYDGAQIKICRPGLGHCRNIANPLNVSYGNGGISGPTGNWVGTNLGSPGFQALEFPTVGQWAERVCWVTDWGALEKVYVACAQTGRPDIGLPAFDLDENTPDNCFDRHGRCIDVSAVQATQATISVKPTSPAFACTIAISTRRDMESPVGTFGLNGPGSDRSNPASGLTSNTQYYASAECGPAGTSKVWDYAVVPFRTK